MRIIRAMLVAIAAWPLVLWADASRVVVEREPNDQPAQATPVRGAATLVGELSGDDQDFFLWSVEDASAALLWAIELEGIPGGLTRVDLLRWSGVPDEAPESLLAIQAEPESPRAVLEGLVVEEGDYLLGVSRARTAGAGSYRVTLRSAPTHPLPGSSDETPEHAHTITDRRAQHHYAMHGQSWYRFAHPLGDDAAVTLLAHTPPGRTAALALHDAQGQPLARREMDRAGRARLANLMLPAGDYLVQIEAESAGPRAIDLAFSGPVSDGHEREPNDRWTQATVVQEGTTISGRSAPRDIDFFRFELTEDWTAQRLSLILESDTQASLQLCLVDESGQDRLCRDGTGGARLDDLVLQPGTQGLRLAPASVESDYRIRWERRGRIRRGVIYEPNDTPGEAVALAADGRARGSFGRDGDVDHVLVNVEGEAQIWRVIVRGDTSRELALVQRGGRYNTTLQSARRGPRQTGPLRLDNLVLDVGRHVFALTGNRGDYEIQAQSLGPIPPNLVTEPSDEPELAFDLPLDGTALQGNLARADQRTYLRMNLRGPELVTLTMTAPHDGDLRASVLWGSRPVQEFRLAPGETMTPALLLDAGPHYVQLRADDPGEGRYELAASRGNPLERRGEIHPQRFAAQARPLPPDFRLVGRFDTTARERWYRLPRLPLQGELLVQGTPGIRLGLFHPGDTTSNLLTRDRDARRSPASLEAHEEYLLRLQGSGEFELALDFGELQQSLSTALPVTLDIDAETDRVRPFFPGIQRLGGSVRLHHAGTEALELDLLASVSDRSWALTLEESRIELAPGETRRIGWKAQAGRDLVPARPVMLAFAARHPDQRQVEGAWEIAVDPHVAPWLPEPRSPLPDGLPGSINVAWTGFGARSMSGTAAHERLLGSSIPETANLQGRPGETVYVELAGEAAVPIHGFLLDATGAEYARRPTAFAVALSQDAEQFETVLEAEMTPQDGPQAFVLPEPLVARYARLVLRQPALPGEQHIEINAFKVLSSGEVDLSGARGHNLADPALGGHMVSTDPIAGFGAWGEQLLTERSQLGALRRAAGQSASWVIAFRDQRSARIAEIVVEPARSGSGMPHFSRFTVQGSLVSPVGPWETLAVIDMDDSGGHWRAEGPVWARYLRFESDPAEAAGSFSLPTRIRVYEPPVDAGYRSALAEWGTPWWDGPYEHDHPETTVLPEPLRSQPNRTASAALPLHAGGTARGHVQLGQAEAWYRLRIPEGHNVVELELGAIERLRAGLEVQAMDGNLRTLESERADGRHHWVLLRGEPGEEFRVRVFEAPLSVVFAWDSSGSVAHYVAMIQKAVRTYARQLRPGLDEAQFIQFDGPPIFDRFLDDPHEVALGLNAFDNRYSGSNVHTAMIHAVDALRDRPGQRAIIVVGDAEFDINMQGIGRPLWPALGRVQPRIYAFKVRPPRSVDQMRQRQSTMQSFAAVNRGYYATLYDAAQLEAAFQRVTQELRDPAEYLLTATTRFAEDPGPARLRVVSERPMVPAGAVSIILDASGSMLRRMEGGRRIDVAKRVLADVIEAIPEGTPVALRVYGNREANACRSDIELPLAPLQRDGFRSTLEGITAINLARTPIADSLAKVADDLAGATGRRMVVLLTDGEETCDGDPHAVIAALLEQGIDLRLNIVGFQLGDQGFQAEFEALAAQAGGLYFDSASEEELVQALQRAFAVPYRVLDRAGTVMATGLVGGDEIEVAPGVHTILVDGEHQRRLEDQQLRGGAATVVTLD